MGDHEKQTDVDVSAVKPGELTILAQQYELLVKLVLRNHGRLDNIKIAFLIAEFIMLIALVLILNLGGIKADVWGAVDKKAIVFFLPISGMATSVVWLAVSMRIQLMQRLHYFQLRQLESKMGLDEQSGIFNQTSIYWSGSDLRSHDGKQILTYPRNADGRMGRITFRVWAWLIPLWFFFAFLYSFVALLLNNL